MHALSIKKPKAPIMMSVASQRMLWPCSHIFPRFILYTFLSLLLIYGLRSSIRFLGSGFSVAGVWALWCVAFWVYGVGALDIDMKE